MGSIQEKRLIPLRKTVEYIKIGCVHHNICALYKTAYNLKETISFIGNVQKTQKRE